jgi:hypothetical protein
MGVVYSHIVTLVGLASQPIYLPLEAQQTGHGHPLLQIA